MSKGRKGPKSELGTEKKLNIHAVASRAKVSTATVSRTINKVPTVDPVLAKRVWRAVRELNYLPNTTARALVSGRSRLLGLIVSDIVNPYFPELIQSFEATAVRKGYEILIGSTSYDPERMSDCVRRMVERGVDGIAVMTFGMEEPLLGELVERNVPIVTVESGLSHPRIATLSVDYDQGIRQAVQHLAALGHREIGFISGPLRLHSAQARLTGFQKAMREIGAPLNPGWIVEGDHTLEGGTACMLRILEGRELPTAVACSNDVTAIGVLHALSASHLRVPENMSVVGFDDIHMARYTVPPLTTVRMSSDELAEAAIESLHVQSQNLNRDKIRTVPKIKTTLIIRRSSNFRDRSMQALSLEPDVSQQPVESPTRSKANLSEAAK